MKLITRDTDYAVRALCYFARKRNCLVSAQELVDHLGIPRPFLRKILQQLNRKHLLISSKGRGGGFRLNRPVERIYLLDLIAIFQGRFKLNECLFKKRACPNVGECILRKKMDKWERFLLKELRPLTIKHLLQA